MGSFNVKNYNIDKTPMSKLLRLNEKHLSEVLTRWSSISNQRAIRMKKVDPMYSGILTFERGGSYGKSGTYKDKSSVITELQRIKREAPALKKKSVIKEREELIRVKMGVEPTNEGKIDDKTFRQAFAMFSKRHANIPAGIYDALKKSLLQMSNKTSLYDVESLIERLYDEYITEEYEDEEDLFEDIGDDLPW